MPNSVRARTAGSPDKLLNSGHDEQQVKLVLGKTYDDMPISARKSSIGAPRRGPQKYIRYRADDLQHGKRTGIAVGFVDRDSDEFEPFEKVIGQADLRTPPKPNLPARKKKTQKTPVVEDYDEDGEMSMELEDSIPHSPAAYLSHGTHTVTSSVRRVGSSSRSVQRHSDVDFDSIPSPRRDSLPNFSARKSVDHSRASRASSLSHSVTAREPRARDPESEPEPINYSPPPEDDEDDVPPPPPDSGSDPERTPVAQHRRSTSRPRPSFIDISQRNEDEEMHEQQDEEPEEEEDEVERHMVAKSSKAQGKRKQVEEELDDGVEEEIAQGLDEVDAMPEEEMDQDEEPEEPQEPPRGMTRQREQNDSIESQTRPSKKARMVNENTGPKKPQGRPRKVQQALREVVQDQNVDDDGLRRSHRMRYKPLEWWRCEKVVYGRRESGLSLVPTIREIRRLPKEEVKPLGKLGRKRPPRSKSKSATVEPELDVTFNPEEGWDDETDPMGVVLQYPTGQEVSQRVAFTARMVTPKPAANAEFSFQKIFGDSGFMAAGQLLIPPGQSKPTKGTKDNTFMFYVIEGAVNFKVHRTSFIVTTGGQFMVPRGNMYFIQNISTRDAKLFFAQARKADVDEGSRSPSKSRTPVPRHESPQSSEEDGEEVRVPMKKTRKREQT